MTRLPEGSDGCDNLLGKQEWIIHACRGGDEAAIGNIINRAGGIVGRGRIAYAQKGTKGAEQTSSAYIECFKQHGAAYDSASKKWTLNTTDYIA